MLLSREVKAAVAVVLLALFLVVARGEDMASAHGTCRYVDVGYTYAGVTAKRLSCDKARRGSRRVRAVWGD